MIRMTPFSILLFVADIFLALALTYKADFLNNVRRLAGQVRRVSGGTGLLTGTGSDIGGSGLKPLEHFALVYIGKSNIRHYIPFFNVYFLIAVIAMIFVLVFKPVISLLGFFPTALVISLLISLLPLFGLDLLARYNSEMVRKKLSEYISVLNRWCSVKEDIIYAFKKSLDSGIGEPLQTFVRDMVTQVDRGMEPEEALDILQLKVDNSHFKDFVLNIKLSMRHRGDITKLLSNLEDQFYRIDEEYNRRRISTYKDRMLIYFVMVSVLAAVFIFIRFSAQVGEFYLETVEGKLLLMLFSGMYAFGFYLTSGIMKFKN